MRTPRKSCEGNYHHVFCRGIGRQLIFEDDYDRAHFVELLGRYLADIRQAGNTDPALIAWCLMGNHFHLLLRMELSELADFMKRLQVAHARSFNDRHERVGALFQGRFGNQPIDSNEQLLACVRYIHRNPEAAGIGLACDYEWSSYREYVGTPRIADTGLALSMLGGIEAFECFHRLEEQQYSFMDDSEPDAKRRMLDSEAMKVATEITGDRWRLAPSMPKAERDAVLAALRDAGLSIRQIERLTGIGRGIVANAKPTNA